ncbi:MAG: peptidylprolyl isomerase [Flavobacteriales bacterium]
MKFSLRLLFFVLLVTTNKSIYSQQLVDRVVAVVGEKSILQSDVYQQILQAVQQQVEHTKELECSILEELLYQSLLIHQAEMDSVEVGEQEVEGELNNRIDYFSRMIGSVDEMEKFYGKKVSEIKDEFRPLIKERLLSQRMQQEITKDAKVSPREIREFYNSIPEDSIPIINAQYEIAHLVIQPQVSEALKRESRKKLEEFRKDIISGKKTFASTALFESMDPGTKGKGGDFGWVRRGDFVPEFEAMAYQVAIGVISEVFETTYGYHILQIYERRGDQYNGRHILIMPKVSDADLIRAKDLADSLTKEIKSGKITFEEAVAKYSTDADTKNNKGLIYNVAQGTSKFDSKELDKQLFVAIDGLKPGDVDGPFLMQTQDGKYAYRIVKLISEIEPHKANLKQDYQLFSNIALQKKQQDMINDWVKKKLYRIFVRIDEDFAECEFEFDWRTAIVK